MNIGIGGAGSKLASISSDAECVAVNVSELELAKVEAKQKILAVTHSARGQLRGSGKNPKTGKESFISVGEKLKQLIKGNTLFTSTGGGTGNGITSELLYHLSKLEESLKQEDRTMFCLVLPYMNRESYEYVENTIEFLGGPVSAAIDSGNTGNIVLFSNKLKFEARIPEHEYNKMIADSLNTFLAVPVKGEMYKLLDGHIDFEDFDQYRAKPYFNHFTHFPWNPDVSFEDQLRANFNVLLLPPERPIEAMFLIEMPTSERINKFYDILDYFSADNVTPMYGLVHNPDIATPLITVSLLYSRKPRELVEDFKKVSDLYTRNRIKKSLEQHVVLQNHKLDKMNEARRMVEENGNNAGDVLGFLKRVGKL
ncbi:MAG TPA: hypothetical protein DD381_02315 [Lentisphaeria bacterium]|nr:MAG: hypothetical protein A2X47_08720 [Lentisphaerae bacterium GWF2_38_69]HBM15171.1 hypothetical protein [Lentisphaeria bacterium]